ncbi:ROK family transcriptional regulator [Agromyces badenianii]|nr:ROK family transcriptional regulator [Agromyces badenianii]
MTDMREAARMNQIDPGTPTWLAARNDRAAFRLMLEHGPLTRSRLGELTGLSKPTASQMLARLERVGLIRPVGELSGGRGPNAVTYGVRTDRITGVAISILERSIQAVVVDAVDHEHPIVQIATDAVERTPEGDVRAAVRAACAEAGIDESSVSRVVIGVQAAFFVDGDELSFTDTLPGWPAVGARRRIEEALGLHVTIDNDVNLATMAERSAGAAQHTASFALFWIGEGLGVGVDLGGVVHRGASGGAGEIGYLAVPRTAAALEPDANDFTDLLGGPAVARLLGGDADHLTDLLPRVAGDEAMLTALADRVILAVDPLLAILDPSMIVLGGPTGIAGGDRLAELVTKRIDPAAHPNLTVRTSGTGTQPVLLGARQQLVDQIRDHLEADISLAT